MDPQDKSHPPQDEERLLQYLDGQLPEPEARATEAHLAVCPECQTLRRQWAQLDEKLARTLAQPRLSPDFASRLRQRVAVERQASVAGVRTPESVSQQQQWRQPWPDHRGHWRSGLWLRLLDGLGYGVAAAVGGYWLYHLTVAWLPASVGASAAFLRSPAFLSSLVAAGAALLVGLNLASRHRLLGWLKQL
jgi:anti-sigma factor RsiW